MLLEWVDEYEYIFEELVNNVFFGYDWGIFNIVKCYCVMYDVF